MKIKEKFFNHFTTYDLLIITIMATLGIVIKPIVVPLARVISAPLMIPGGAFAGGLYMLWLVVGFGLVGKYGTATLIAFIQALVVLFSGVVGSHGIMSLISYTMPGIVMDLGLLILGHKVCCRGCAFIAGLLANTTGTLIVNFIFFGLPSAFLFLALTVAAISGGIGGLISWELLKRLKKYNLIPEIQNIEEQEEEKI